MGPEAIVKAVKRSTPALFEQLPQLPKMAWEALDEMRKLSDNQERFLHQLETRHLQQVRRDRITLLTGCAAVITGAIWAMRPDLVPELTSIPWPAWILGISGSAILLTKAVGRRK